MEHGVPASAQSVRDALDVLRQSPEQLYLSLVEAFDNSPEKGVPEEHRAHGVLGECVWPRRSTRPKFGVEQDVLVVRPDPMPVEKHQLRKVEPAKWVVPRTCFPLFFCVIELRSVHVLSGGVRRACSRLLAPRST